MVPGFLLVIWASLMVTRSVIPLAVLAVRNVQHRDLKLDNILTDSSKEGADVKLVDFGLSAHFEDFKLEHDIVGTWVSGGMPKWVMYVCFLILTAE